MHELDGNMSLAPHMDTSLHVAYYVVYRTLPNIFVPLSNSTSLRETVWSDDVCSHAAACVQIVMTMYAKLPVRQDIVLPSVGSFQRNGYSTVKEIGNKHARPQVDYSCNISMWRPCPGKKRPKTQLNTGNCSGFISQLSHVKRHGPSAAPIGYPICYHSTYTGECHTEGFRQICSGLAHYSATRFLYVQGVRKLFLIDVMGVAHVLFIVPCSASCIAVSATSNTGATSASVTASYSVLWGMPRKA